LNEIFDKLLIKILITSFILFIIFSYRYIQKIILNRSRSFALKSIYPQKNTSHAIHVASRILGFAIILSDFSFFLSDGLFMALFDFFLYSITLIILYGLSLYVFESIALYNFSFEDEIYKRKNISFSTITFGLSISSAFILKKIFFIAQGSIINLFFLWLFTTVLFGFALKTYNIILSKNLNQIILQKNNYDSISHVGFSWSWTLLITSALDIEINSYTRFMTFSIIQIILSIIIFPIFHNGINKIFFIRKPMTVKKSVQSTTYITEPDDKSGINDALLFLATAYLTSLITSQVHFGSFYPPL